VEDALTAAHRLIDGLWVAQITVDSFNRCSIDAAVIAAWTEQHANVVTIGNQAAKEVGSQVAAGPGQ
jgi:hypothetical protein